MRSYLAGTAAFVLLLTAGVKSSGQGPLPAPPAQPAAPTAQTAPPPVDPLGRATPFGTVKGFLLAASKGDDERAARYLDTPLRGEQAEQLARQLFVILDRRMPPTVPRINNTPEGSRIDSARPDEDVVASIDTETGKVDILVERVDRGRAGSIWLFAADTLETVPYVYAQVNAEIVNKAVPAFLTPRILSLPIFEWLIILGGFPLMYLLTALPIRALGLVAARWRPRFERDASAPAGLPERPLRLLLMAGVLYWLEVRLGTSLIARQFWANIAATIAIGATIWLLIVINGVCERYMQWRWGATRLSGKTGVLRLARRAADFIVIVTGLFVLLHHFGVNPAAAATGLGVGGIAIALAAQKTLENVIAGTSLIFDEAVRVGDSLKAGEYTGTVEAIGLRSTRIRTPDRTLVAVPNGQIATLSLENISARDKFWFHPLVRLRPETTAAQVRSVVEGVRALLAGHPAVEQDTVRVRFLGFGAASLDVDVYAYVRAGDVNRFLEIQEGLLFTTMEIVQQAGALIAIPPNATQIHPSGV